ncbi:FIST N-terminal domain-containing protein [Sulfurovum sp.]|uniref:FIST N-terminal domain-containing protein n=1 Tax=Sulfurovum sp. TaxID=1969726 RepID=UPI002A358DFB|nr:FIST N-terminal domain-containing protein [Sulfurovum sp.]MDY0403204.1 FIST N-terminal domain-containing protein [Sulfurovum sp.]
MKTVNLIYTDNVQLGTFIHAHGLTHQEHILIQVFTGIIDKQFITALIENLLSLLPQSRIIGATSDGIIDNHRILQLDTLISFSVFNTTVPETYISENPADSYRLGQSLAHQFPSDQKIKAAICLTDGLHTNGEEFLNGLSSINREVIIAGGLAGDNGQFKQTYVFCDKGITSRGAVSAILYGEDLIVSNYNSFGWQKIGKTLTITKCNKNRVYTIDGMNATEVYAKYLGDEIRDKLPSTGVEFPLIIQRDGIDTARAVVKKHSDGSLSFAGNLKEGEKVHFGYGNTEHILFHREQVISKTQMLPAESIFIYSCMARRRLLGEHLKSELNLSLNTVNVNGFFTYGEFFHSCSQAGLLNQSLTLLILSESPGIRTYPSKDTPQVKYNDSVQTVNALSHLIAQTTEELTELNQRQESIIRHEVAKNREKDQLLLHQSKLAQMGEMINMIAHQWRQPLNTISSVSSSLLLKSQLHILDQGILESKLRDINTYIEHLSTTINDFREFFRPNREKEITDIVEVISSLKSIIGDQLNSDNISLEIIIEHPLKPIFSYPNEIKQVILNLIKNATDAINSHCTAKGKITIHVKASGKYISISITDNGGGIPAGIREKVFEAYFTTKEKDGTGIGLYMSNVIVKQHLNGSLAFHNTHDGTAFVIKLPAASETEP